MSKVLEGKVALVTGGSRGLGAATALRLAHDGADIAISYHASPDRAASVVEQLRSKGVRAAAFKADQGDPEQAAALIRDVVGEFGRLDVLVNNAAVTLQTTIDNPELDVAQLDRQHAVNYTGLVAGIREAVKHMHEGARIINIGSGVATRVGGPGLADYTATKAALAGYTRGAARDLAPRGITVNLVQAGLIDTEMNPANSELAPAFSATTALGRYAQPEEVAVGVAFLARPDSTYVTGTVLDVDGGYSA
jgi:3-oxoacyl-[acyl-carrier protein] reductase